MTPPGVILRVASGDSDFDGIPDWAHGMTRWGGEEYETSGASLEPMLVHLVPRCATMRLTFNYDDSDPALLSRARAQPATCRG